MSMFTHGRDLFACSSINPVHGVNRRRLSRQKASNGYKYVHNRRLSAGIPENKLKMELVSCGLYTGGLWLELFNSDSMQLIQVVICRAKSKEKVVGQSFALPKGKTGLFWSFSKALCPEDTYVLLIRGEKHLLQWKFP